MKRVLATAVMATTLGACGVEKPGGMAPGSAASESAHETATAPSAERDRSFRSRLFRSDDFSSAAPQARREPAPYVDGAAYAAAEHLVAISSAGRTAFDLVRVRDSWPAGQGVLGHFELGGDLSGVLAGASAVDRGGSRYFFESLTEQPGQPASAGDMVLRGANIHGGVLTSAWTTGELHNVVYDPATHLLYALRYDPAAPGTAWFTTVNPNTGTLTQVAALDIGGAYQGSQTVEPGRRYFVSCARENDQAMLVGVDVTTGAVVTAIPTMELTGIEYDGVHNAIYALHSSRAALDTTDIVRVDLAGGQQAVVVTVPGSASQGAHAYNAAAGHFFYAHPTMDGVTQLVVVDVRAGAELGRFPTREVTGLEFDGPQFPPL